MIFSATFKKTPLITLEKFFLSFLIILQSHAWIRIMGLKIFLMTLVNIMRRIPEYVGRQMMMTSGPWKCAVLVTEGSYK